LMFAVFSAAPLPTLPLEDELEHATALIATAAIPAAAASILIRMDVSFLIDVSLTGPPGSTIRREG
jgi:hypothetical protein